MKNRPHFIPKRESDKLFEAKFNIFASVSALILADVGNSLKPTARKQSSSETLNAEVTLKTCVKYFNDV